MKNFLCLILISLFSVAFGQKADSIAFERISKINHEIEDLIFNSSQESNFNKKEDYIINLNKQNSENYNQFLNSFPDSKYIFSALHGKALTELVLKNYESSKDSFLKTLKYIHDNNGKTDDNYFITFGKDDEKLLNEIYKSLANIEMAQKNYFQAIKYLDESQKNFTRIWCGNGFYSETAYIANLYSECYLNLNDDEKICDILIPVAAVPMVNENSVTVTRLYSALIKKYKKDNLKKIFEESFKNLYSKEGVLNARKMIIYYVKFLNRDIILYDNYKNLSKEQTKEKLNQALHFSKFYTLLSK